MRLVIGTTNPGKVAQMAGALAGSGFECVAIGELVTHLPHVEEVGDSPSSIAEVKAAAYRRLVDGPVLAIDQWLFFDEVPAEDQPGPHVRRIRGHPGGASDDDLIDHYIALAHRHGGSLTARWRLGVALADGEDVTSTCIEATRTLITEPSPVRRPGLPLSCLQIDHETGKYVSEHTDEEEIALWQRVYGAELVDFVHGRLPSSARRGSTADGFGPRGAD